MRPWMSAENGDEGGWPVVWNGVSEFLSASIGRAVRLICIIDEADGRLKQRYERRERAT